MPGLLRVAVALVVIAFVSTFCSASVVHRGDDSSMRGEYEVKAAFLFNFAKFVEWPVEAFESSESPLVIGVLGKDPFGSILDRTVSGKKVRGRKCDVMRCKDVRDALFCHVLFVGESEQSRVAQVLQELQGTNVLMVGEMDKFIQSGGTIRFRMIENRVRFEINPAAAERNQLRMSSKLMKLAEAPPDNDVQSAD